jgi:hypothetical protein
MPPDRADPTAASDEGAAAQPAAPDERVAARPAAAPSCSVTAALTALMERISAEYTEGAQVRVAAEAREAFLLATGRVHEGDRSFDQRMAQFMEWFLLDRPLPPGEATPAERWAETRATALEPSERALLLGLCTSHRALFCRVGAAGTGRLVIDDLLYGLRWVVTAPDGLPGVDLGDVFEGRLVGVGGQVHFTAAFCYHPPEVAQRIRHHLERVRPRPAATGLRLLEELMCLRLAYDRAEGAPASSIYRLGR